MAELGAIFRKFEDWAARLSKRAAFVVAFALGLLAGLGHAPLNLFPLTVVALFLAYGLLRGRPGWRSALLLGWGLGAGYFALTLHWIVEPFFVDPWRHGWMSPFALFFVSTGFGMFWAAGFTMARAVAPQRFLWLAWPVAMAFVELVRAYVLTGFPWAMLSYVWLETPLIQLVSLVGSHGLTLLMILLLSGAYEALRQRRPVWLLALPLPFLAAGAAGVTLAGAEGVVTPDRPVIRIVQPNAPQHQKWDPAWVPVFFERALEATSAVPQGAAPALIVWPETSVPLQLHQAGPAFRRMQVASGGVPVVAGILRREERRFFNSLVVLGDTGPTDLYDKHHLVPFGEYIPGGAWLAKIGIRGLAAADGDGYSSGPGARLLDLGNLGRVLPLICYEAIFPQDVAAAPERPAWLLQITNDAWFGDYAGPQQHFAQARIRTIEQGLPMVRAANTGISAMIDTKGRVTGQLALGKAGFIDRPLPLSGAETLYAKTGDWPVFALVLALLAGLALLRARNSD